MKAGVFVLATAPWPFVGAHATVFRLACLRLSYGGNWVTGVRKAA